MAVLSISSQIVAGRVGNSVALPAFAALGVEAWGLPTVLYSHTPSPRGFAGASLPFDLFESILGRLESDGSLARLDAVHVGYVRDPAFVARIAEFLVRARDASDGLIVSIDPVLGDDGKLYVPEGTARAVRDDLVPLADILTPNHFELGWLTGRALASQADAIAAARALRRPTVLVTSASADSETHIATLLVEGPLAASVTTPRLAQAPHGTGDLLAALFLGRILKGEPAAHALAHSVASVVDLVRMAAGSPALPITEHARLLASPESQFGFTHLTET